MAQDTPGSERAEGAITYSFATPHDQDANIIYVNVIPGFKCVNLCRFCSRPDAVAGKPNIYEEKAGTSLYLPVAPSVEEVTNEVRADLFENDYKTDEIAIVGLGEPLLQFELVRDFIKAIREYGYEKNIRIDTDGLVKCWYGTMYDAIDANGRDPACELRQAGLDEIRISVNAINEDEYKALCRPTFDDSDDAFGKLCEFVGDCISEGIDTKASFVTGFEDDEVKSRTPGEYTDFAVSLGIKPDNVILRKYIKPIV